MFRPTDNLGEEPVQELEAAEDLIIGLSVPQTKPDASWLYEQCSADGYTFCTTDLPQTSTQARSDVTMLNGHYWHTSVVGLLNETNGAHNNDSNDVWEMPLEWAWHMTLPVVILPRFFTTEGQQQPAVAASSADDTAMNDTTTMDEEKQNSQKITSNNNNTEQQQQQHLALLEYARKLGQAALHAKSVRGNLWIPLALPGNLQEAAKALQQWSTLNRYLKHPSNIGVLLDMKPPPPNSNSLSSRAAWVKLQVVFLHHLMGQGTIRGIRFSCSDFLTNKTGYPTLSKGTQYIVAFLLQRLGPRLRILVQGPSTHFPSGGPDSQGTTKCKPYFQYLQHIRHREDIRAVLDTSQARLEEDHCDRLQRPLQPLRDHLDNDTYEIFEKDPVKYKEYQRAISMAIADFVTNPNSGAHNNANNNKEPMVIMVVGAGRGPLVSCVIRAFELLPLNRRPSSISLWAVEKNPSAVIYLASLIAQHQAHWSALPVTVRLVQSDLRNLSSAKVLQNEKADLVVSELLGSFGDNELSPECLDALFTRTDVCHEGTVSIPTSYTAYLAPASSIKLHQEVTEQALFPNESEGMRGLSGEGNGVLGIQVATETPYVVRPRVASQMGPAAKCWTFAHPLRRRRQENGSIIVEANDMNRSAVLEFVGQAVSSSPVFGCGYGPLDDDVGAILEEAAVAATPTGNNINGSVTSPSSQMEWTLTGFLGTFSADLYVREPASSLSPPETVRISIVPETYSKGMFSWFPLYFPLAVPLQVPGSDSVSVYANISRHSEAKEHLVWYEWSAVVQDKSTGCILDSTAIHNPRGRSFFVSSL